MISSLLLSSFSLLLDYAFIPFKFLCWLISQHSLACYFSGCFRTFSLLRFYLFWAVLGSQHQWGKSPSISHTPPCPHTCRASPITDIPDQRGPSVTTDEATLTHHRHHPKSTTYTAVHSGCCTLYGFGHVSNDLYPLLWYLYRGFSLPQILSMLCLFIPPIPNPWQPLMLLLLSQFGLFQNVIVLESVCSLFFRLASFT